MQDCQDLLNKYESLSAKEAMVSEINSFWHSRNSEVLKDVTILQVFQMCKKFKHLIEKKIDLHHYALGQKDGLGDL